MLGQCEVCCEKYTVLKRKPVECLHCQFVTCCYCVKKYIMSTFKEPHCMKCKKHWNTEFIDQTFSIHFRKTVYREYRENLLLEREKAFLPETQTIIEINREQLNVVIEELKRYREQRDALSEQIKIKSRQHKLLSENPSLTLDEIVIELKKIHQYNRKCPEKDCRGFINNRNNCGICKCHICPLCLEKIENDNEHECDINTLETVKKLQKECKTCPKCDVMIYKIDGCNQMWCTQCHTAFDWKTKEIINTNRIHNPHYFEYMNRKEELPINEENICGGDTRYDRLPTLRQLHKYFLENPNVQIYSKYFQNILRAILHMSEIEIYRFTIYTEEEIFRNNMILRIQYLNKEISEKMFKMMLIRDEKQREKNMAIRLLLEMLINTMVSIFQELFTYNEPQKIEECILIQVNTLRSYVNEHLLLISHKFDSRKIYLSESFLLKRHYES